MRRIRRLLPGVWALEPATRQALETAALRMGPDVLAAGNALPAARTAVGQQGERDGGRGYRLAGDIALIPMNGLLTPYPTLFGQLFGDETTHDDLRAALTATAEDAAVRARIVIADSPGGPVAGLQRLADDVRASDRIKPVYVYTEALLASAAYFALSQARRIYTSPEGMIGSIGTLWVLYDTSELFAQAGVRYEGVASGPRKGLGWDGRPISAEDRAAVQRTVDDLAGVFRRAVMRGRGLSPAEVEAQSDGWIRVGSAAVQARLADRVATLDEVLAELGDRTVMPGRAGARAPGRRVEARAMDFKQWLVAQGYDPANLDDETRATLEAQWRAENRAAAGGGAPNSDPPAETEPDEAADDAEADPPPAPGTIPPPATDLTAAPATEQVPENIRAQVRAEIAAANAAALQAERDRVSAIRAAARGLPIEPRIVEQAITSGRTAAQAQAMFLNAVRLATHRAGRSGSAGGAFAIHTSPDVTRLAIAAAVLRSQGRTLVDPLAAPGRRREQEQAMDAGTRLGSPGPLEICEHVLRMRGLPRHNGRQEMVRAAIGTGDLTYIFSNIIGSEMIGAYAEAPDTTAPLVRVSDVPNFQTVELTEAGLLGNLELLPRDAEAAHTSQGDKAETLKIARYAKQRWCDERDIIDDRFGVLTDTPSGLAQAAARLRPDLVYALLMGNPTMADGEALFSSAHANIGTSGSVFGKASLAARMLAMNIQTKDSAVLNLQARYLVVPPALALEAKQWLESPEVRTVDAGAEYGTTNPLNGLGITRISESRLQVGVTNPATKQAVAGSETKWWLFAAPAVAPVIVVAYLRGTNRRPSLAVWAANGENGRWGIGYSINLDIGAAVIGYLGAQYATGES